MGRPLKEGMDYFPHDVDVSMDEKIQAIEALHGNDGYATYFKILERIYRQGTGLELSTPLQKKVLATACHISEELLETIIGNAIEIGLFEKEHYETSNIVISGGIVRRMEHLLKAREGMRRSRAQTTPDNSDVTNSSQTITNPSQNETNNKRPYGEFLNVMLSDVEVEKLKEKFGDEGFIVKVGTLSEGIKSKNYRYEDHYATILSWERKDQRDKSKSPPKAEPRKQIYRPD